MMSIVCAMQGMPALAMSQTGSGAAACNARSYLARLKCHLPVFLRHDGDVGGCMAGQLLVVMSCCALYYSQVVRPGRAYARCPVSMQRLTNACQAVTDDCIGLLVSPRQWRVISLVLHTPGLCLQHGVLQLLLRIQRLAQLTGLAHSPRQSFTGGCGGHHAGTECHSC